MLLDLYTLGIEPVGIRVQSAYHMYINLKSVLCLSRGDWKQCQKDSKEEAARTERFKSRFKAYDLMQ